MPKEVQEVTMEYLQTRRTQTDKAIGRIIKFHDAILGKYPARVTVKIPDIFNLTTARNAQEWQERKERVDQANRKIPSTTLPILRIRERQIPTAVRELEVLNTLNDRLNNRRVSPVVVDLARESFYGAADNLLLPIRPLREQPEKNVAKQESLPPEYSWPFKIEGDSVVFENGIKVRGRRAQLLALLSNHPETSPASPDKLMSAIWGTVTEANRQNLPVLVTLTRRLLHQISPNLQIQNTLEPGYKRQGERGSFYLEVVKKEEKQETPPKKGLPHAAENHLSLINLALDNSYVNQKELIEALGLTRKGQIYKPNWASYAIKGAFGIIKKREIMKDLNEAEKTALEKARKFMKAHGMRYLDEVRDLIVKRIEGR